MRDGIARGDPDFTAFYAAGKIVRQGHGARLYDPQTQQIAEESFTFNADVRRGPLRYIHPPFEALVFLPLTFLPYVYAFVLWNLLNLAMLAAALGMIRDSLPTLHPIPCWELVLAALSFFPVFANFHQGQDAILLLLLFVLGFRALGGGQETLAGCWFGVGLFRYHLAIPLVLILGLWGRGKLLRGFGLTAAGAFLLSAVITGWHGILVYPAYIWQWAATPRVGRTPAALMPSLAGLIAGWPISKSFTWMAELTVLAASGALLVWAARMRNAANGPRSFNVSFAFAVIAAGLLGYNTSTYDLALLVLPVTLIADDCLRQRAGLKAKLSIILPAVPLLISPLWFLLWMRWERINLMAIFLLWWIYAIRREILRSNNSLAMPQTATALT